MPFLTIKTNQEVNKENSEKIKSALAEAITLVPGKSEQWLFIDIEDKSNLYFRGKNDEPILFLNAAVFNNPSHAGYAAFTEAATKIFNDVLAIPLNNIIINYADAQSFGLGGQLYSVL